MMQHGLPRCCIINFRYRVRHLSTLKAPETERATSLENRNSGDSDSHQVEAVDIANSILRNKLSLKEEAAILTRLGRSSALQGSFIHQYVSGLEERIKNWLGDGTNTNERHDHTGWDITSLQHISSFLMQHGTTCDGMATLFERYIKNSGHYLVPNRLDVLNGLLQYLVHAGAGKHLASHDFDLIGEFANDIPVDALITTLYLMGQLGIRNVSTVVNAGRLLHNRIAMGLLSPYHKTKLVRAYALMRHEHITFFRHIAEELRVILEGRDTGKYLVTPIPGDSNHILGIGSHGLCEPSGVICNVLPCLQMDSIDPPLEPVLFTGHRDQLYTDGQILYILDSMFYLNLHYVEPFCRRLANSAYKHCYVPISIDHFDVEQLRSAVTILAVAKIRADESVLEAITRRFFQSYLDGIATNSMLCLFLKDFVKLTRDVIKSTGRRGRVAIRSVFKGPRWLEKPLSEIHGATGHVQPSMLESCCTTVCERVHSFDLLELTSCIRSIAYLGYRNENFYKVFIPYFKDRIGSMNHVAIINLTQLQAYNKVGIRDGHLFYLMGKQHQLHLQGDDNSHKLYVKRIG
uniref:RAP domain-containing protein n=1 Tax=Babesia bovis TaxID=5865 RepID=A7AWZ3_BABBO|eukprot:XP_001609139.1 hypothetical protein [Babesia bovis T2Bo]